MTWIINCTCRTVVDRVIAHSAVGSGVAGIPDDHAQADRLAARADSQAFESARISQRESETAALAMPALGIGIDRCDATYFFAVSCGVGRSEYDVRDHTFTPSRFVT